MSDQDSLSDRGTFSGDLDRYEELGRSEKILVDTLDDENKELKNYIAELQANKEKLLKKSKDDLTRLKDRYELQISTLNKQNQSLVALVERMKQENADSVAKMKELRESHHEKELERYELMGRVEQKEKQISQFSAILINLTQESSKKENENKKLTLLVSQLKEKISILEKDIRQMEDKIECDISLIVNKPKQIEAFQEEKEVLVIQDFEDLPPREDREGGERRPRDTVTPNKNQRPSFSDFDEEIGQIGGRGEIGEIGEIEDLKDEQPVQEETKISENNLQNTSRNEKPEFSNISEDEELSSKVKDLVNEKPTISFISEGTEMKNEKPVCSEISSQQNAYKNQKPNFEEEQWCPSESSAPPNNLQPVFSKDSEEQSKIPQHGKKISRSNIATYQRMGESNVHQESIHVNIVNQKGNQFEKKDKIPVQDLSEAIQPKINEPIQIGINDILELLIFYFDNLQDRKKKVKARNIIKESMVSLTAK